MNINFQLKIFGTTKVTELKNGLSLPPRLQLIGLRETKKIISVSLNDKMSYCLIDIYIIELLVGI